MMLSESEPNKFNYLIINLIMIIVGAMLGRLMFPFALTIIGLAIIYLGTIWQRHEASISSKLRGLLPMPVRELLERRD